MKRLIILLTTLSFSWGFAFPPLTPYRHCPFNLQLPQSWTVEELRWQNVWTFLIARDDHENKLTSSDIWLLRYTLGEDKTLQDAANWLLSTIKPTGWQIRAEESLEAGYVFYAQIDTQIDDKPFVGSMALYSLLSDNRKVTLVMMSTPKDRFAELGGVKMPLQVVNDEALSSSTALEVMRQLADKLIGAGAPAKDSSLALETYEHCDLELNVPEGWAVDDKTGEQNDLAIRLRQDPNNPKTSPDVWYSHIQVLYKDTGKGTRALLHGL